MLSAEQDGNRAESMVSRVIPPSGGMVGKVVNSIQGLRQRLNDYTLEEIVAAENKSRTLMLGLLNLQSRVDCLIAIKRSMAVVFEALQKTKLENVKLSVVNTSGKPIHLNDIIQASNLIRFPGFKRTSNQSPVRIVTDNPNPGEIKPAGKDTSNATKEFIRQNSSVERREETNGPNEPAFVFGAPEIGAALEVSFADFSWDKDSDSDKNTGDNTGVEQEIQTTATGSSPPVKNNNAQADLSGPESVEELPPLEESNTAISKALVPSGGDFDQRLLDDLIKNYGEFFSSSDSSPKVASQAILETVESGSKPIFLENPAAEIAKAGTTRTSPLKKEVDIDRELKKIIKDYGEYDIYSRHKRSNLKFAAMGAFLLVVAAFSGFYLFSSTRSLERSSPSATEAVSRTSDEHPSGIDQLEQPAKTSETKTPQSKSPIIKK